MRISRLSKFLAVIGLTTVLIAGCGGGGGGGTTTTNNNNTTNDNTTNDNNTQTNEFAGSSSISGSVELSSLSGSDAQAVANSAGLPRFARALGDGSETSNAVVKLYVVGADGELEDTGIDCSFTGVNDGQGNPGYTCDYRK